MKRAICLLLILLAFSILSGCRKSATPLPQETDGTIPDFTISMTMPVLYDETQEGS